MENPTRFFISMAGIPLALFIFLAPLGTVSRIISKKSTEYFSVVPYVMTLFSCLLSAWYGVLLASPDTVPVPMLCGVGAVLESAYVMVFIIYARTRKQRAMTVSLLLLAVVTFSALALIPLLLLDGEKRNDFCTAAAGMTTIAMYASPMVIMPRVMRTNSIEYMPGLLSLSLFLYAAWANIFSFNVKDYARFAVVVFPMDLDIYWEGCS